MATGGDIKVDFSDLRRVLDNMAEMANANMPKEEWKLEIRKADNGYILTGKFGDSDMVSEMLIEEDDDELSAIEDVLWGVLDYFGCVGNKWDEEKIGIIRQKGYDNVNGQKETSRE